MPSSGRTVATVFRIAVPVAILFGLAWFYRTRKKEIKKSPKTPDLKPVKECDIEKGPTTVEEAATVHEEVVLNTKISDASGKDSGIDVEESYDAMLVDEDTDKLSTGKTVNVIDTETYEDGCSNSSESEKVANNDQNTCESPVKVPDEEISSNMADVDSRQSDLSNIMDIITNGSLSPEETVLNSSYLTTSAEDIIESSVASQTYEEPCCNINGSDSEGAEYTLPENNMSSAEDSTQNDKCADSIESKVEAIGVLPLQSESTDSNVSDVYGTPREEPAPTTNHNHTPADVDDVTEDDCSKTAAENTNSSLVAEVPSQDNGVSNSSQETSLTTEGEGNEIEMNAHSEIVDDVYEFLIPSDYCGMLIGKRGATIVAIKDSSGADIQLMQGIPGRDPNMQICSLKGSPDCIEEAIRLIKKRFPRRQFPKLNLTQINKKVEKALLPSPMIAPESMQLTLVQDVSLDVVVSSIVSGGHLFVQQPTHPTFSSLERLNQFMVACYNQDGIVPQLPRPIDVGVICAAPMYEGWYRAQVVTRYEDTDECDIKYLDYGGYTKIHASYLKQIRSDFMTLPFQAVECYLANVIPLPDEDAFSLEAASLLQELTQGHLLQSRVTAVNDDGTPYVSLFLPQGSLAVYVNREMANKGLVQWEESQPT